MNKLIIYILLMTFPIKLIGQLNLLPKNNSEKILLKRRILNNTDHGYFGMETGIVFLLGQPTAITPGAEANIEAAKSSRLTFRNDYSFLETSKLYVGYAFKSHHFELATGGILGKMYVYDASATRVWVSPTLHGTLMLRYYYRIPFKSNFVKLLLGGEFGWAYRIKSIYETESNSQSSAYPLIEHKPTNNNIVGGLNARLDFKLAKNLTFNFQINYCAAFPNRSEFRLLDNPNDINSPYTAYLNSIMNLNLSLGLKFDFFSEKKKQQTFNQLGIKDPYTD